MADAVEDGEKIFVLSGRLEADAALAEVTAGEDFGLQFVVVAKKQVLADADFTARADQTVPLIGGNLAGEKNLDASVKKVPGRGILRGEGLRTQAFAAAVESRGKDSGVVEYDQVAGMEKIGKITELAIGEKSGGALEVQHAGTIAGGKWFLRDEFFGKMKVEIGNKHAVRL